MKTAEALEVIARRAANQQVVVSAGDFFGGAVRLDDSARYLHLNGAYGHATSVALGLAKANPDHGVLVVDCLDLTGAGLATLAAVAGEQPANLYQVVLDPVVSPETSDIASVDFRSAEERAIEERLRRAGRWDEIAWATGYRRSNRAENRATLDRSLESFFDSPGPSMLVIEVVDVPGLDSSGSSPLRTGAADQSPTAYGEHLRAFSNALRTLQPPRIKA